MSKDSDSTKFSISAYLKEKKFKKALFIVLFVLLNVVVIAATAISEFGNSKNAAELSEVKINWWLLIPATLCFVVALTLEIYKYKIMIAKMAKRDTFKRGEDWKIARRTVILGRYYDNITPAAIGGQPFQIYYMHKNGKLSNGLSTAIPILGMITIQITFIIIAAFCFLFGNLIHDNPALIITAAIGLLFYAFWPAMVAVATFFPKATAKIINFGVKILAKFKIIKNRDEAIEKVEKNVHEYVHAIKMVLGTRGLFTKTLILSLIFNILMATIPYLVLTAFGGDVSFGSCFVLTIAVMSAVYFVPTPGNSGAAEGTFFLVFSALSTGYVFWAMLFWRLFSYYIYIAMGPITYFFMQLEKRRENKNV